MTNRTTSGLWIGIYSTLDENSPTSGLGLRMMNIIEYKFTHNFWDTLPPSKLTYIYRYLDGPCLTSAIDLPDDLPEDWFWFETLRTVKAGSSD